MVDVMTQNMESRNHMAHIMMNRVHHCVLSVDGGCVGPQSQRLLPVSIAALAGQKKKSA